MIGDENTHPDAQTTRPLELDDLTAITLELPPVPPEACTAEVIAKAFHDAYELLAPTFDYRTRTASAVPWRDVPEDNKQLMIATVRLLLANGLISLGPYRQSGGD